MQVEYDPDADRSAPDALYALRIQLSVQSASADAAYDAVPEVLVPLLMRWTDAAQPAPERVPFTHPLLITLQPRDAAVPATLDARITFTDSAARSFVGRMARLEVTLADLLMPVPADVLSGAARRQLFEQLWERFADGLLSPISREPCHESVKCIDLPRQQACARLGECWRAYAVDAASSDAAPSLFIMHLAPLSHLLVRLPAGDGRCCTALLRTDAWNVLAGIDELLVRVTGGATLA